jgi:hypothetical protein
MCWRSGICLQPNPAPAKCGYESPAPASTPATRKSASAGKGPRWLFRGSSRTATAPVSSTRSEAASTAAGSGNGSGSTAPSRIGPSAPPHSCAVSPSGRRFRSPTTCPTRSVLVSAFLASPRTGPCSATGRSPAKRSWCTACWVRSARWPLSWRTGAARPSSAPRFTAQTSTTSMPRSSARPSHWTTPTRHRPSASTPATGWSGSWRWISPTTPISTWRWWRTAPSSPPMRAAPTESNCRSGQCCSPTSPSACWAVTTSRRRPNNRRRPT